MTNHKAPPTPAQVEAARATRIAERNRAMEIAHNRAVATIRQASHNTRLSAAQVEINRRARLQLLANQFAQTFGDTPDLQAQRREAMQVSDAYFRPARSAA